MTEWNLEDMGWRHMRIAPCPFCGRVPVIITADMNNQIGCDEPGCGFSIVMDGDPKRIIQYWNRLAARDPDDRPGGERIEPCPGCGSGDIIRGCESTPKGEMFYIGCRQCGYTEEESDPGLAIAKWNREGERMTSLKQCPCCGSTRIHVFAPDDGCRCWDCSLTMPNVPDWRERWNRRASEPYPCSECERIPAPRYVEGKGWAIGCCHTNLWYYRTKEGAVREWNGHWKNRRARELEGMLGRWRQEEERMLDDDEHDLKRCPFCGVGKDDLTILDRQDYGMYWKTGIYCHGCRSTILYDSDTDDEDRMLKDAVAKWNRRRGSE